jgi:hypothetical protein
MATKAHDKLKKSLSKNMACYVLITCSEPSDDGQMNVELSYEGEETLASFLIENAQMYFDEKMTEDVGHA